MSINSIVGNEYLSYDKQLEKFMSINSIVGNEYLSYDKQLEKALRDYKSTFPINKIQDKNHHDSLQKRFHAMGKLLDEKRCDDVKVKFSGEDSIEHAATLPYLEQSNLTTIQQLDRIIQKQNRDPHRKLVILSAANSSLIGGGAYCKRGNVQEEQICEVFPFPAALLLKLDGARFDKNNSGKIYYPTKYHVALEKERKCIKVSDVPGYSSKHLNLAPDNLRADILLASAPNLHKTPMTKARYAKEMFKLWSNIAKQLNTYGADTDFILTVPGDGVFTGGIRDEREYKKINGYAMKKALSTIFTQKKGQKLYIPKAGAKVMSAYKEKMIPAYYEFMMQQDSVLDKQENSQKLCIPETDKHMSMTDNILNKVEMGTSLAMMWGAMVDALETDLTDNFSLLTGKEVQRRHDIYKKPESAGAEYSIALGSKKLCSLKIELGSCELLPPCSIDIKMTLPSGWDAYPKIMFPVVSESIMNQDSILDKKAKTWKSVLEVLKRDLASSFDMKGEQVRCVENRYSEPTSDRFECIMKLGDEKLCMLELEFDKTGEGLIDN